MFTVRPVQCLARAHAHRLLPYSCKRTLETFQSPIVEWLSECSLTCRLYATNIGGDTVAVMPLCPSCISPYPHSSLFTPLCISALPHSSRVLPHFLPEMHRTKRDVLKQTKKVRWGMRPSQLFLNIFEANDMRNKCGIKLCTRVNNNCSTVVEMLSIEAVFGTHSSMLCMYLRVDVCKYICWYTVTIEAHVWSVSGGPLSAPTALRSTRGSKASQQSTPCSLSSHASGSSPVTTGYSFMSRCLRILYTLQLYVLALYPRAASFMHAGASLCILAR